MKEKIEFLNMTTSDILKLKQVLIEIKENLEMNKDFNNFVSISNQGAYKLIKKLKDINKYEPLFIKKIIDLLDEILEVN